MRIYLACPYSHPVKARRLDRFRAASKKAAELMVAGHTVFSPLSHSVPIADYLDNHLDYNFWLNQDFEFINWCDEIWILRIEGWEESRGVRKEIKYAKKIGKPVKYTDCIRRVWPDLL